MFSLKDTVIIKSITLVYILCPTLNQIAPFLSLDRLSLVPGQLVHEESNRYDSNGLRFLPGDGIEVNIDLYIV